MRAGALRANPRGDGRNKRGRARCANKREQAIADPEIGRSLAIDHPLPKAEDDDASEEEESEESPDDDLEIMLNVDMGLVLNLEGQLDDDGEADCDMTTCPTSVLLPHVVEYAANEPLFLNDFRDVLTKVTLNGLDLCTLNIQAGVAPLLECLDPVQSSQPSASPVDTPGATPSPTPIDDGSEPAPEEPCGIFRGRLCWQYWWD